MAQLIQFMQTIAVAEKRIDITNIARAVSGLYLVDLLQASSCKPQAIRFKLAYNMRLAARPSAILFNIETTKP